MHWIRTCVDKDSKEYKERKCIDDHDDDEKGFS